MDATEEDFHRALSLAHLVDDQAEMKQKIWCAAILRDNWEMYNVNAPLEAVQSFTFYKLVDLCLILCEWQRDYAVNRELVARLLRKI